MLKNLNQYIGVTVLILFSFYYTDKAVDIVKRNDPIMKNILSIQEQYKIESVNAQIEGDTIIPGLNGISIDIEESYKRMKKLNGYYESMLVFKDVIPDETILEQYDKFIVSGNQNRSDISFIIKVSNLTNLEKVYKIFLEKNNVATFFIDGTVIENNMDLIYEMVNDNFEIENFGYNGKYSENMFSWTNNMLYSLTNIEPKYCYSEYSDYDILKLCSTYNMYTVKPTFTAFSNPFYTVQKNLKEGSIVSLHLTEETIKELPALLSYVKQKGYNIVSLRDILSESRIEEK